MLPLRIHETEREGFDAPVVELWRDDDFVGMVFHDGEATVVQIYPTEDGDVHDLDLDDLFRALEMARAIVDPEPFGLEETVEGWEGEDPATVELLAEFDPLAVHRSEEGEGFFRRDDAQRFIARCEELGLAVVEMEGLDLDDGTVRARPGLDLVTEVQPSMQDAEFRRFANVRAAETLEGWPDDPTLVIAFVVHSRDGEEIVA